MKNKTIKRICIWLAGTLLAAFLCAAAGAAVNTMLLNILVPAYYGWSSKDNIYSVQPANERNNGLTGIGIRDLMCNRQIKLKAGITGLLIFSSFTEDETIMFFDADGRNERSTGIFASVYPDDDILRMPHMCWAVGVADIGKLCQQKEAREMFNVLMNNPEAVVHVNSYTVNDDYIVTPVSVTVNDKNGSKLADFTFDYTGDLITGNYLLHNPPADENTEFTDSLCEKMNLGFQKERKNDRIAEKMYSDYEAGKYSDMMSVRENSSVTSYGRKVFGFGEVRSEYIETTPEGRGMISVISNRYLNSVIADTLIITAVMTAIMFAVWHSKDRKSRAAEEYL